MTEPTDAADGEKAATAAEDPASSSPLNEMLRELRKAMLLLHKDNEMVHLDKLCREMEHRQMPASARLFVLAHGGLSQELVAEKSQAIKDAVMDATQLDFQIRCILDFVDSCKVACESDYDYPPSMLNSDTTSRDSPSSGSAFQRSKYRTPSSSSAYSSQSRQPAPDRKANTAPRQLILQASQPSGVYVEPTPPICSTGQRSSDGAVRPVPSKSTKSKSTGGDSGGKWFHNFLFPDKPHKHRRQAHNSTS